MNTPSATKRQLKNTDTGIDISVPKYEEESAPLGGVSILYEVSILSTLELFKSTLHSEEDVVHFSIFKAYRELHDLQSKLSKKFPNAGLPTLPNATAADKLTSDQKVEILDSFMQSVAKNVDLCSSSIFVQFMGLNSSKQLKSNVSKVNSSAGTNESEVFPKMKIPEKSQSGFIDPSLGYKKDLFDQMEDRNLERRNEAPANNKKSLENNKNTSKSLFDEFDDDNLFSSAPTQKKVEQPKEAEKKVEKKKEPAPVKQKNAPTEPEKVDDSAIIIKDRKFGDVSLFDEQDFGGYITKDEEALFLVTPPEEKKTNSLITMPNNKFLATDESEDSKENLDDLLNLSPLPSVSPVPSVVTAEEKSCSEPTISAKPVPLPRKKSLGNIGVTEDKKPEVMPRKVFLNKNENVPKPKPPVTSPKPAMTKPKPPVKPKPPPKTSKPKAAADLDAQNANKSESNANNSSTSSSLTDGLKELDIIKYIEQEEKSLVSNLSLFD